MRNKPYIGVTGFTNREQVDTLLESFSSKKHLLMIGVLVSRKTARGGKNRYPERYPAVEEIPDIFSEHPSALNLVHYHTDNDSNLSEQLCAITRLAGPNMHGLQLNIAWPSVDAIEEYLDAYPKKKIVLQIGARAFEMVEHLPEELAERVWGYCGTIDYVLLDGSGGKGIPMDPKVLLIYLRAIRARGCGVGLGVAGGLSAKNISLLKDIVREFPDISIDAEGRLRDVTDKLIVAKSTRYLKKAIARLEK